jgi:aldehyde dehydrogenase (NAD+)
VEEYRLFINGRLESASDGKTSPTIEPATEEPWAEVASASVDDVDRAVSAARKAHESGVWRNKSPEERGEVLAKMANAVLARTEEIAPISVRDGGATMRTARMAEIMGTVQALSYYAGLAKQSVIEEEHTEVAPVPSKNIVRREPVGVVAAITPFNMPMALSCWKIGPALAAGNTVVLKPSPNAPVLALLLGQIASEAGAPDGVLNVIASPEPAVGEALVTHPGVNKISFTGSTRTGKQILASAAKNLTPVLLELGGKSADIVLEDADLDTAARGAAFGMFWHSGQVCMAGTRILVADRVYDEFVNRFVDVTNSIRVGNPMEMTTDMGPLVSGLQLENTQKFVKSAIDDGCEILSGGGRPEGLPKGYFHEPTVFANVRNDMPVAREEIFGPVAAIIRVHDDEEAIRVANDSDYGLAGGVWTKDIERGVSIARQVEAGTMWVNDYHMLNMNYPFGGYKQSGIGRELGTWGLGEYQQLKHVHVGEPSSPKPYTALLFGA